MIEAVNISLDRHSSVDRLGQCLFAGVADALNIYVDRYSSVDRLEQCLLDTLVRLTQ